MLAPDEIVVRIDGQALRLRPSLQAALRLERRYGFPELLRAVSEGNVGALADVIREGSGDPDALRYLEQEIGAQGLRTILGSLQVSALAFVLELAGVDQDASDTSTDEQPESTGKKIPFADYFTELYRIGTGVLGWTPETTWNATPQEILEAHRGRLELLKAIFGSTDKPTNDTVPIGAKVHAVMASLGARIAQPKD